MAGGSSPDGELGLRIVCRRNLLGIEGFSVCDRCDQDFRTQRAVLSAVYPSERQLRCEVRNSLKAGFRLSQALDRGIALHRASLLPAGRPALFNWEPRRAYPAVVR